MRTSALKFAGFLLILCLFSCPLFAQRDVVNGTLTDPNGVPYAFATVNADITPGGSSPCLTTATGCLQFIGHRTANANAAGTFSMTLEDNPSVTPAGTKWTFTVTIQGAPLPLGTGPQQCTPVSITISSNPQNVGATINAGCPALANFGVGAASASVATPSCSSGTVSLPFASGSGIFVTDFFIPALTTNCTISGVTGPFVQGNEIVVALIQDATGGRTVAWPANFLNPPAVQSGANQSTVMTFQFCGTAGSGPACPANDWAATDVGVTAGSAAFNTITSGTNTTAAMIVGTGASLSASGTGSVTATQMPLSGITGMIVNGTPTNALGTLFSMNSTLNANSTNAVTFTEGSAATNGTITNGLANQSILQPVTVSGSTAAALSVVQGSVTGTTAFPALQVQSTFNNAGLTGIVGILNLTDTNSAAGSELLSFRKNNTEQFGFGKSGAFTALTSVATGTAPAVTAGSGGLYACTEGTNATALATADILNCNSANHDMELSNNGGTFFHVTQTIASGTATMTTAAITAGNCGTTVTVSATNVLTTDTITWAFNAAPAGSNAGLVARPTANNVNFAYCPNSAETPAAATINWRVLR